MKQKYTYILAIFFLLFTGLIRAQDLRFYRVDTLSSKVFWQCDKHNGIIKLKDGGFVLDKKLQPVAGRFVIDMSTIKDLDMDPKRFGTAVMILQNTLKNEFFEIEKYPFAVFDLQEIEHLKDDEYRLTGDFTLHGITICLSFKAKIKNEDEKLHLLSETFTIDRTDWGVYRMSPKRPYSDDENGWTVPDEINLRIDLTAKPE